MSSDCHATPAPRRRWAAMTSPVKHRSATPATRSPASSLGGPADRCPCTAHVGTGSARRTNDPGRDAAGGRSVASVGSQPSGKELDMTTQTDETKPTIVLVHGAWADATGFDREIRALQERGFRAVGFGNSLRGLPGD